MIKRIVSIMIVVFCCGEVYAQQVRGIDVSHHQKIIDWDSVAKDGVAFAYIKATEGKTYKDPRFDENIKGANRAGLPVGAYHYFRMTSGARDQFENYRKAVDGYDFQLIPMVDVETSDGRSVKELQDSLDVFISLVMAEYGCAPMIYGTQRSYNTYCAPKYNIYHLYIGRYGPNKPEIIGKGSYSIWQYTEKGRINGISHPVDICVFNPKYDLNDILKPCIGIDISHHNDIVDWENVVADFVYVKATEGATWQDPDFKMNIDMVNRNGIPVGAYHFLTTSSSAKEQFEAYKTIVKRKDISLIPMLDVEKQSRGYPMGRKEFKEHVREWITLCEAHYGHKPIIYSSVGFYLRFLGEDFDDCLFWCGDICAERSYVDIVDWTIWQYEVGNVRGAQGKIDKNILHKKKGLEALRMN